MKCITKYIAAVIGLAIGSLASTAFAQTTANGPYYATPSWDQTLPSSTRFIVLSNMRSEAVLDRETGLVWERTPTLPATSPGGVEFRGAIPRCWDVETGGRKGWHLPRTDELLSLGQRSTVFGGSPLPEGHPFIGVIGGFFWTVDYFPTSGTTVVYGAYVYFDPGNANPDIGFPANAFVNIADPASHLNVWCVRGGQASPAPAH